MITFALAGITVGAILGSQFAVCALIPMIMCAAAISMGSALVRQEIPGAAVSELLVLLAFVQVGYPCGALIRLLTVRREKARGWSPY